MKGAGFSKRGSFRRKSGPPHDPDRMHLHIICTDEDEYGVVLVVPLCSLQSTTTDLSCILHVDDHPYITHESYIHYRKSEILDVAALQESLRRGDIIPDEDCPMATLELICSGLLKSKAARENKKSYLRNALNLLPEAA